MNNIILNIINSLKNVFTKETIVFIISMMPVLELRGGIIAASILKLEYIKAAIISITGNILPIPFILILLKRILLVLEKFNCTKGLVKFLNEKAIKNKPFIDKYGFLGLVLFVGIPLPGTGAWTGALVASVFDMDIKKSFLAILLGIFLAFIIMSIISYGIISNIIK